MYRAKPFGEDEIERLHAEIERIAFATLVTVANGDIVVSHIPMLLDRRSGSSRASSSASKGVLRGHLAKANTQWCDSDPAMSAMAIFNGPGAYVSPGWYPSKAEHGKVVPTWNYIAVQARGPISWFDDPEKLTAIVSDLTGRHEAGQPKPWAVTDAPADFIRSQLSAIIGFEIEIDRLEGVRKLSQNRPAADRSGVEKGLAKSTDCQAQALARAMKDLT